MSTKKKPTVFISYSHDTQSHKNWVTKFGKKLKEDGINVKLDLFDIGPGGDIIDFMEQELRQADRVLMICSSEYVKKAEDSRGPVAFEISIIKSLLLKNVRSNKFISIIRNNSNEDKLVPEFLKNKLFVDFRKKENYEVNYLTVLNNILDFFDFQPIINSESTKIKALKNIKHELYGLQKGDCSGCGIHLRFDDITIDHIIPKQSGGTSHRDNLQLLCPNCNAVKGARSMSYLKNQLKVK